MHGDLTPQDTTCRRVSALATAVKPAGLTSVTAMAPLIRNWIVITI